MNYKKAKINSIRQNLNFNPDETRVITKIFGLEKVRIYKIINRILDLSDKKIKQLLEQISENFSSRHIIDIKRIFKDNFDNINSQLDVTIYNDLPLEKKLLIGSYFTMEYSIESAALFNPSVIPHPNQGKLKEGELRVIISFRAVGEGHMSSVVFKEGIIESSGNMIVGKDSNLVEIAKDIYGAPNSKSDFILKLKDLNCLQYAEKILDELLDEFTYDELKKSINHFRNNNNITPDHDRAIDTLYWLESSNYEIEFDEAIHLSQRVIFPRSTTDIRAIEDARFVNFIEKSGEEKYYGTYTAYNGFSILPQLIETKDFLRFKISTLMGEGSQNKGMALFPEKINGKYAIISRNDAENLYIMYSDNIHYWDKKILIREPKYYWEFVQIGNSGSPLKTENGWLLLTHGVGPMRIYSIGAILLDLNDPTKVIGEIEEPILIPQENERNGYVPNVVYSCG
ncbi:MAG: glycoside hydrolase family 130 protein, partial [Saprospiraceae bacterium]|nr:glycoside hydrolase family 130 protein [Saprospiraceae bacterium]